MAAARSKSAKNLEVVRYRLSIIGPLLALDPHKNPAHTRVFNIKLKEISASCGVSTRQLRRWVQRAGEDPTEGLLPRHKGNTTLHNVKFKDFDLYVNRAVQLRAANPNITVAQIIEKLEQEYPVCRGLLKRSTMQRHLQENNVSKHDLSLDPYLRAKGFYNRFEMPGCLQLVQGDLKYLPKCIYEGRLVKAYFVGWIDDKSRKLLTCGVFTSQQQSVVSTTLRNAVEKYGHIEALYMDNGSIYKNRTTHYAAAVLGTKVLHTLPNRAWSKGKIERFNKELASLCHTIESNDKPLHFAALASLVYEWVDKYNRKAHSALNGRSPDEVFFEEWCADSAIFHKQAVIETAFLETVQRKVTKDGTVKYQNVSYEIPLGQARTGTMVELAVRRNGTEISLSLIKEDLKLQPLKELTLSALPNRAIQKDLTAHKNPLPQPLPGDKGAALKLEIMHLLESRGCNFNFDGRKEILDEVCEIFVSTGSIDAVLEYLNGNSGSSTPPNSQCPSAPLQAGYSFLVKSDTNNGAL